MNVTGIIAYKNKDSRLKVNFKLDAIIDWWASNNFDDDKDLIIERCESGILVHLGGKKSTLNVEMIAKRNHITFSTTNILISTEFKQSPADYVEQITCSIQNSSTMKSFLSPFFLGYIEGDKIGFFSDPLGFGRCYKYEDDDFLVASNHIALCAVFSRSLSDDYRAWLAFSAFGWFTEASSPYKDVDRIAPAQNTCFNRGVEISRSYFDYDSLFKHGLGHSSLIDMTVAELQTAMRNLSELSAAPVNVMLSGGRDSRLTAAAALAAGTSCSIRTLNTLKSEVDTAKKLMEVISRESIHVVVNPVSVDARSDTEMQNISQRAENCMHLWSGDYNPNQLARNTLLRSPKLITIGGGGGELAHGNYYSSAALLEKVYSYPDPTQRLKRFFAGGKAVNKDAEPLVVDILDRIREQMAAHGINGPSTLDGFYLVERFRRWVAAGHRNFYVAPYSALSFVRLAMIQSPEDRLRNRVHKELTSALVPEWKDIPYFKAKPADFDERSDRGMRIWQGRHSEEFYDLLASACDDELWDREQLTKMANDVRNFGGNGLDESCFQKVIWKHAFDKHQGRFSDFLKRRAGIRLQ